LISETDVGLLCSRTEAGVPGTSAYDDPKAFPRISHERILQAYPLLEPADIDDALAYAAWRMEEREEVLILS
jgi:hypothetical protein